LRLSQKKKAKKTTKKFKAKKKPFRGNDGEFIFHRFCPSEARSPPPSLACLRAPVPVYLFFSVRLCRLAQPLALRSSMLGVGKKNN